MAASNCISALSLVDVGRQIVVRKDPFPSFFNLFHWPNSIPFPEKFNVMGDMPTLFGSNLEELLRHHPTLMRPCIRAMVEELKIIAIIAGRCNGVTLDAYFEATSDEAGIQKGMTYRYSSLLHAATSALHCLEGILVKVEHVKEFLSAGGLGSLLRILRMSLGPPRYFIANLSCSVENSLHSIGHYPIVKTVTRLFQVLAQKESKMFLNRILIALDMQLDSLSSQLHVQQNECKAQLIGDPCHHSKDFPLHNWLDFLPSRPLHQCADSEELTSELVQCSKTLQAFVTLDYLVDALSIVVHVLTTEPRQRPLLSQLAYPRNLKVLSRLIDEVYVGSQFEVSRARANLSGIVNVWERSTTNDHPIYKLLVVAQDSISVRENQFDTSSKKMYKLEKGSVFYADSRSLASGNMLQYHVIATSNIGPLTKSDNITEKFQEFYKYNRNVTGWVNLYRNVNSVDPQIEVIDLLPGVKLHSLMDDDSNNSSSESRCNFQKKVRYDKLASVSPNKAGFMALFHLHGCLRHLLSSLAWSCSPCTDHPAFSRLTQQAMPPQTLKLIPLVANCLIRLLPSPCEICKSQNNCEDAPHKPGARGKNKRKVISKKASEDQLNVAPTHVMPPYSSVGMVTGDKLDSNFFVSVSRNLTKSPVATQVETPQACLSLDDLSTDQAFRVVYVVELCHYLLFESKNGTRSEPNMVMLVHLYYNGFIERLAKCTALLFLACLGNDSCTQTAKSLDVDCKSSLQNEDVKTTLFDDLARYNPAVFVNDECVLEPQASIANCEVSDSLAISRKIQDRQLLIVADIDLAIDLWKNFFRLMPSSSARSNQVLLDMVDTAHCFDSAVLTRKMYILWSRYLGQVWNHDLLYTLPPNVVKNILELVHIAITSYGESSDSQLRSTGLTKSKPSSKFNWLRRREERDESMRMRRNNTSFFGSSETSPHEEDVDFFDFPIANNDDRGDDNEVALRPVPESVESSDEFSVDNLISGLGTTHHVDPSATSAVTRTRRRSQSWGGSSSPRADNQVSSSSRIVVDDNGEGDSNAINVTGVSSSIRRRGSGSFPHKAKRKNKGLGAHSLHDKNDVYLCGGVALLSQPLPHALPSIAHASDEEVIADREVVKALHKSISDAVIGICYRLIERGIRVSPLVLPGAFGSAGTFNASCDDNPRPVVCREVTTVVVLSKMFKCLEKPNWLESTQNIIHLKSLYGRAISLLNKKLTVNSSISLYGILHAISLILTNKVGASPGRGHSSNSKGHELVLLIFGGKGLYFELYSLLLNALELTCREVKQSCQDANCAGKAGKVPDSPCFDWMTPAFLILDSISQPLLVDQDRLRSSVKDFQKVYKTDPDVGTSSCDENSLCDLLTPALRSLLSSRFGVECDLKHSSAQKKEDLPSFASLQETSTRRKSPRLRDREIANRAMSDDNSINKRSRPNGQKSTVRKSSPKSVSISNEKNVEVDVEEIIKVPLFENNGLSLPQRLRYLSVSLDVLDMLDHATVRGHLISQAMLQGLIHFTRHEEVRSALLRADGVRRLTKKCCLFRDKGSTLFTLLQHMIEDETYLRKSMETAMKLCIQRVYRSASGAFDQDKRLASRPAGDSANVIPRVSVRLFLEILAPLVYRNQKLFLDIFREEFRLFKCPRQSEMLCVGVQRGSLSVPLKSVMSTFTPTVPEKKSHVNNQGEKDGAKSEMSSKTAATTNDACNSVIQLIVDQLLFALFERWVAVKRVDAGSNVATDHVGGSGIDGGTCDSKAAASDIHKRVKHRIPKHEGDRPEPNITISELLILLADLVTVVPGFATCVHKFSLQSALSRHCDEDDAYTREVLTYCLGNIPHVITGRALSSHGSHFLAFLVHCLMVSDYTMDFKTVPSSQQLDDSKGTKRERQMQIAGTAIHEAPSYLFAALVSRAGDGRRRALKELLNALRLTLAPHQTSRTNDSQKAQRAVVTLDTTSKLRAALCVACNIKHLLVPKAAWRQSEMLVVPTKDIVDVLMSLKCYAILSEAMCAVPLNHPLALQVALELAIPLEFFVKKGLPASLSLTESSNRSGQSQNSYKGCSSDKGSAAVERSPTAVVSFPNSNADGQTGAGTLRSHSVNVERLASSSTNTRRSHRRRSRSSSMGAISSNVRNSSTNDSGVAIHSNRRDNRRRRCDISSSPPTNESDENLQDSKRRRTIPSHEASSSAADITGAGGSVSRGGCGNSMESDSNVERIAGHNDDREAPARGSQGNVTEYAATHMGCDQVDMHQSALQTNEEDEVHDDSETMNLNLSVLSNKSQDGGIHLVRESSLDHDMMEAPIETIEPIEHALDVDNQNNVDVNGSDNSDEGDDVVVTERERTLNYFAPRHPCESDDDDDGGDGESDDDVDDDDEGECLAG